MGVVENSSNFQPGLVRNPAPLPLVLISNFDLFSRCREALPYLVHACNLNSKLLNPGNPGQAMSEQLLTHWRRVCFLRLNELAVRMFESSDWKSVCGGLELVSELVVPCIPRLSASSQADDSVAVEQVRNCWCNFLASQLDGKKTPQRLFGFVTQSYIRVKIA